MKMLTENLKPGTKFELTDVETDQKYPGKIVDLTDEVYEYLNSIIRGYEIPVEGGRFCFEQKQGRLSFTTVKTVESQSDGSIVLETRNGIFRLDIIND